MEKRVLPLPLIDQPNLFITTDKFAELKDELESFLDGLDYMNSQEFARKVLFNREIQSNNIVEDYHDDVELVDEVIRNSGALPEGDRKRRIVNLHSGYKYMLSHPPISQDNLRELYQILSSGLLEPCDAANMGPYYRGKDVFIHLTNRLDINESEYMKNEYGKVQKGIRADKIEEYIGYLMEFIDNCTFGTNITDRYIKSQIIHFYFVYIHPYFDINGRTARTLSMWYLMTKAVYAYIIFNRAIIINKNEYYKVITESKKYHNLDFFIQYMMKNVKIELEKEFIMQGIKESTSEKLTAMDYQTLHRLLSMAGNRTFLDFATYYNRSNDRKKLVTIREHMIEPLINKGIIIPGPYTKKTVGFDMYNYFIQFNPSRINDDPGKIQRLRI